MSVQKASENNIEEVDEILSTNALERTDTVAKRRSTFALDYGVLLEDFTHLYIENVNSTLHYRDKQIFPYIIYIPIKGKTLEDCDLVKLGNEMKDILDKCIDNGVKNSDLIICGLLVE
ncbi:436_t:CDS:2, partial [Paraglomus brasilianum]